MDNISFKVQKSKELADEHRNRGNEFFKHREFKKALTAYNESLCKAPTGSTEVALAYGNRSAVYCEAKLYTECLENIELARANGFPVEKMSQLDVREVKVKKLLESEAGSEKFDPWSFFKLSYPANEKIPFIVNCLELRENEKFGRHIITNQDLKTGDVIAIEKPFYAYVEGNDCFSHCSYCVKWNKLNLFPCSNCANTMYCTQDCLEKDYAHQSINCYSGLLQCTGFASMALNSLRVAGGVIELIDLLSDNQSKTVFDFDLSNPKDPAFEKNQLIAVNSLQKKACTEQHELNGHLMTKLLLSNEKSKAEERPKTPEEKALLQICLTDYARTYINSFVLSECGLLEKMPHKIGGGLFPFTSLLNHSCDPNIDSVFVDGKMLVVVSRPIKAGEQICTTYGPTYSQQQRDVRRYHLKENFEFFCDCNACVNDYPAFFEPFFVSPPNHFKTLKDAIGQFKKNCKLIQMSTKKYPSKDVAQLIQLNEKILSELADFVIPI